MTRVEQRPRAAGRLRPGDRVWVDMPDGTERVGTLRAQGRDSGGAWAVVAVDGMFSVSSPEGEMFDAKNVRKMPLGPDGR